MAPPFENKLTVVPLPTPPEKLNIFLTLHTEDPKLIVGLAAVTITPEFAALSQGERSKGINKAVTQMLSDPDALLKGTQFILEAADAFLQVRDIPVPE